MTTPEALLLALHRQPFPALDLPAWDRLLRAARASNLIGRLALAVDEVDVPMPVRPHLLAAHRLLRHQRDAIRWEAGHLAAALAALQLPVLVLKGAAYALDSHPAADGRLFGDIDLLVPRAALRHVEVALQLHGWSAGAIDRYDNRYYREWMHELPPMANHLRGTVVDVHHNILPLSAKQVPDVDLLFADSEPIAGTPFRRLSAIDQFIHSATHLFHEGEMRNGLRDLYDLHALLQPLLDTKAGERLVARAVQLRLAWPVLLGLRYTRRLLGTAIPPELEEAARLAAAWPAWRVSLLDAAYLRAFQPLPLASHSYARSLGLVGLYLRSHALRMPPGRLLLHLARKAWLRLFKHSSRQG